jgi:hypothetical protein
MIDAFLDHRRQHWKMDDDGLTQYKRQGSSVSIVTELRAGRPGFDSLNWQGRDFFIAPYQTGSGARPVSYPMGTGALSLVKRPGREADHSSASSAEVKNALNYTSTLPYVFLAWYLVKHTDSLTGQHLHITHYRSVSIPSHFRPNEACLWLNNRSVSQ